MEDGRNLYDWIRDYETLCAGSDIPSPKSSEALLDQLHYPGTRDYQGSLLPDVCGRACPLPGHSSISYLPGNNGDVVEVRERIDFQKLFEQHAGQRCFDFLRQELGRRFDLILLNAPAGHQEISGIFCGQIADLVLAIDLDTPATTSNPSYEACLQLARRLREGGSQSADVQSVRGHPATEVVRMILQPTRPD